MSKLDKLLGKSKNVVIGEVEFNIKPLPIEHLELFLELEQDATRSSALKKLIELTIKVSVPDATDEEIKNVAIAYFKDFVEVILSVNGLKDDNKGKDKPA